MLYFQYNFDQLSKCINVIFAQIYSADKADEKVNSSSVLWWIVYVCFLSLV